MPKYNVDGTVLEVTLNTVKIENFDNTITTIPPFVLTGDSFKNWRWMEESGGRRIMRSISIDMSSVRFCTPEAIERYRKSRNVRPDRAGRRATGRFVSADQSDPVQGLSE